MSFNFKNPHKIRVVLALVIILLGLINIGLVFTPYGNPPQCSSLQQPDNGDNCIIGANVGAGFMLFFGLVFIWMGLLSLLTSFAYRAHQLRNTAQKKLLIAITAVLLIAPPALITIYTAISVNKADKAQEQDATSFRSDYRSIFVEYNAPPNWNEVSKISSTTAYSENESLALYLNQCEAGKSVARYVNGSTYFVFSGVKDNKCVFYVHTQSAQASIWDSLLRTRCIWDVNSGEDNTQLFKADQNGIVFGDFLTKNCNSI